MNENSSQTIKEISDDNETKNSSVVENTSETQNKEDLSFGLKQFPSTHKYGIE